MQHSFGDECSQPNAQIRGHHVHEAETGDLLEPMKCHFRVVKYKVELEVVEEEKRTSNRVVRDRTTEKSLVSIVVCGNI